MGDLVLQTVAKLIVPFIQLYGMYIVFYGHISPGGGFAGGAIIASSFILYALAYDVDAGFKRLPRLVAKWLESLGGLIFIIVGVLGLAAGVNFLTNFLDKGTAGSLVSGGIIPLLTIAIGLKVCSTIVTLFYHLLEEGKHD
ncbi:MAG: sodium:proton antiporter [Firmicutes bacterium]|nr:sodium:proton antiporter [Bacillota bacterium]